MNSQAILFRSILFYIVLWSQLPMIQAQTLDLQWAHLISEGVNPIWIGPNRVDSFGNTYSIGHFEGFVDMDPGIGVSYLWGAGGRDIFIVKNDLSGNFLWAKETSGVENNSVWDFELDRSGNLITVGTFEGSIDLDPGPDNDIKIADGFFDAFIQKLSPSGEYLWGFDIGSWGFDNAFSVTIDDFNNITILGAFQATVDFDPDSTNQFLLNNNDGRVFMLKLDEHGNFLSARQIDGIAGLINMDQNGNQYYIGDYSTAPSDLDPSPTDTFFLPNLESINRYIGKLDPSGNFLWAKNIGGGPNLGISNSSIDNDGNIYIAGVFTDTVDLDIGPGIVTLEHKGSNDAYVAKLDSSGNIIWAKQFSGIANEWLTGLAVDQDNSIYLTGMFQDSVDFDPNDNTSLFLYAPFSSTQQKTGFVLKLDEAGELIWLRKIGNEIPSPENINTGGIYIDELDNVYFSGSFYDTLDLDPDSSIYHLTTGPLGFRRSFFTKWSQDSCANLNITFDEVNHLNCSNQGSIFVHAIHGQTPYLYTWNSVPPINDSILIIQAPGVYTVSVEDNYGCTTQSSVLVSSHLYPTDFDLTAHLITGSFRPGIPTDIWIDAMNDGCIPTSGNLYLVLDTMLTFQTSNPAPTSVIGDTLIWDFDSLVYDSSHFLPHLVVVTDTITAIGDSLSLQLQIYPITGDANSSNNTKAYTFEVVNSYDPNDKHVYPEGACDEGYVLPDQELTYTIRFQNTGNADAINVYILDTLDASLDFQSVRVMGQSHNPMITEVLPNNILKFRFDNIYLPDSTSNEVASHGYVIFQVYPQAGLTAGTQIRNQVGIYFDFNAPIITNSVSNIVVDSFPIIQTTLFEEACHSFVFQQQTYTTSGTYTYLFTSSEGCDSTVILNLEIDTMDLHVYQEENNLIVSEDSATYQWIRCNDEAPILGADSQQFSPEENGIYAVVVSKGGCTDTSSCFEINSVSIDTPLNHQAQFYPNPVEDELFIGLETLFKEVQVEIYNSVGQQIAFTQMTNKNLIKVDFPWPSGIYFIHIKADGRVAVNKVRKE